MLLADLFGVLKKPSLCFSPYAASLVGCQALLLGKPRSLVLLALEAESGTAQGPAVKSLSCAARSLSPSHTADELAPPPGAHRHCNTRTQIFYSERGALPRSNVCGGESVTSLLTLIDSVYGV